MIFTQGKQMNNREKGEYLLDGISRLQSALDHGRLVEFPCRMSLRERIRRVLRGTKAECITENIQDKYLPKSGDFSVAPVTVLAAAIKGSSDDSLTKIFQDELFAFDLGL